MYSESEKKRKVLQYMRSIVRDLTSRIKKNNKMSILSGILAILHWTISFYTDKFVFKYYDENISLLENLSRNHKIVIYKILFLILLLIIWNFIIKGIIKIKNKDDKLIKFLKYFIPYWIIMIVFLLVTWPGIWRWDEFTILNSSVTLNVFAWQHYLTSVLYIFSLMIIPIPGGILFIQVTIISGIIGYIISKFSEIMRKDKSMYLLYVPFLLFPVIDFNLYSLRLSLYSYLELLFFSKIIFLYYSIEKDTVCNILILSIISALLVTWRSEGIILIIILPAVLYILFHKKYKIYTKLFYITATIVIISIFTVQQNYFIGKSDGIRYSVTAYVEQLDGLIKVEKKTNPESELLKSMDKFIDVNKFCESESGESAFWNGGIRDNFNKEDLEELKKCFISLTIKYPEDFFKERVRTFLITSALYPNKSNQILNSSEVFDDPVINDSYRVFRENYKFNFPINKDVRKYAINLLEGRNINDYYKTTILYLVMYNLIIPIVAIVIGFAISLFKRKILDVCIGIPILCQLGVMFLAAPGKYFMYYFPYYLIGYFFIAIVIINKFNIGKNSDL